MRRVGVALLAALALATPALADACATLERVVPRASGPVFLASYPTAGAGPLDKTAFTYDNAVAAIALVACGKKERAAQIGDAFLVAQDHDRFWKDGRLRNGYLAGPVDSVPVKLAGWWEPKENRWVEDSYQVGSDTGNLAWVMLALETIFDATGAAKYREGAQRIGRYLEGSLSRVKPMGFDGGMFGDQPTPFRNRWKSTEHNTDLAAAFARLSDKRARRAAAFVAALWRPQCQCFAAGTTDDGHTPNTLLALDAQIWPLLALPGATAKYGGVLKTVEHLQAGEGFAYSDAGKGLWTEGTAQAALLYGLMGNDGEVRRLNAAVETQRTPDGTYYASNAGELATGFVAQSDQTKPLTYLHLPHLGALAWVALAETRFNPFTGKSALPR